ncbi:MAG: glutathione S-transferase family protein [Xanthomonadales bacterium]|nr:glutathione S-transferase family protein [Xanthomonadales bacterium]
MPPILYAHPFSSYCQKALIALYENATPFVYRHLDDADGAALRELEQLWPLKRFPLLVDGPTVVIETSCIIEHLDLHHPGHAPMLPKDPRDALQVRMLDRFFDNYVSTPQQKIVFDAIRDPAARDAQGVREARAMLDAAYAWLERHLDGRTWAVGESFSLADCAAAPFLFYADWTHAIDARFARVHAYRRRLLARPSFARCVDEARPFRHFFPLGAPDRD